MYWPAAEAQVAIFDATNSTEERRNWLVRGTNVKYFHPSSVTPCPGCMHICAPVVISSTEGSCLAIFSHVQRDCLKSCLLQGWKAHCWHRHCDSDDCLLQRSRFHGRWQYLFIESICNDPMVLDQNIRYKMMYSPDYTNCKTEEVNTQGIFVLILLQQGMRFLILSQ